MIPEQEILRRRDMRDTFTFTIDPATAKDFDDALSYRELEDGLIQVGIHIADVSYYVQPGSDIDEDAYERGTSTYLVDRVLPMLPSELCDDICSLRPNEEKLCMSVVFTLNDDAEVQKYKICRTVICSNARLDYEQAQAIIDGGTELQVSGSRFQVPEELSRAIVRLHALAQKLRRERMANGALDIEQDEVRFVLDEHNHPIEIYREEPTPSHHLIEEFMLLANRTVAQHLYGHPMVWRIHDIPDPGKMRDLSEFRHRMRSQVSREVIAMLTVRAMAKAEYSTHNIGHYGLRFPYYTHFTSPIRRYPDLIVHRLVALYVLGERPKGTKAEAERMTSLDYLKQACEHLSECEVAATQAERDSIKEFQALWVNDHLEEVFDAHITGVTDYGLFVRLDDSRCEGLVHVTNLPDADRTYYMYDEANYRLIADTIGRTFTLGDALQVRPTRADAERRQIDFLIVEQQDK